MLKSLILSLLVADVLSDQPLITTHRRDEVAPHPEVLPNKIALPLAIDPGQVDRALTLMNPITCDTAYFGGIEISMCT